MILSVGTTKNHSHYELDAQASGFAELNNKRIIASDLDKNHSLARRARNDGYQRTSLLPLALGLSPAHLPAHFTTLSNTGRVVSPSTLFALR